MFTIKAIPRGRHVLWHQLGCVRDSDMLLAAAGIYGIFQAPSTALLTEKCVREMPKVPKILKCSQHLNTCRRQHDSLHDSPYAMSQLPLPRVGSSSVTIAPGQIWARPCLPQRSSFLANGPMRM